MSAPEDDALAPLEPRSLTALFDVSNKCNIRCRMCYFAYDSVFFRRAVFMSPETFERIAANVLPLAHTVYLSAGSEPLTNPRFPEILRIAARHAPPRLKMLTNGLLIGPEIAWDLVRHGMTSVDVSVDGATRATYEHVRRGGDFALLKRNLRRLADMKIAAGRATPLLQFNVVLMRSNLRELGRFVDLASELGVEQIACRHLMPYEGLGMEDESAALEPGPANEAFLAFLERATEAGIRVTSFPDFFPTGDRSPLARSRPPRTDWTQPADPAVPRVDPERPFGRIDHPDAGAPFVAAGSAAISGWALDTRESVTVEIRREAAPGETGEWVPLGAALQRNGARPDVAGTYPRVPFAFRAGFAFELAAAALPKAAGGRAAIHVVATTPRGATRLLGRREIVFESSRAARPFLYCRKPFDNVYFDAAGNVYPYPDCQTVDPFGSLAAEASFRDIWFGHEFRDLRKRIAERRPPKMCLTCPDFINRNVGDTAFFRARDVERDFKLPTGFLDEPADGFAGEGETILVRGWALSFAGIARVEIVREALPGEAHGAGGRTVVLGLARLGAEARPDVAALYPRYPGRERAGFRFEIRRGDLPVGSSTRIRAIAFNADGGMTVLGSPRVAFAEALPT